VSVLGASDRASATRDALSFLPVRLVRDALAAREPERALAIGGAWGRRVASLGGTATDLSRINLGIAFPDATVADRERLLGDAYSNLGRGIAELALLQGPHREAVLDGVRFDAAEHIEQSIADSPTGGVLVVSAHFGTWDLYAAALARRYPLTVVHRGFGNERLTRMMTRVRGAGDGDLEEIRMGPRAAGRLLGALRDGRIGVVLLDQNARAAEGVFVPFFSRLACTRSAPALIAMRRGVPVVPVFGHRVGEEARHVVSAGPPLDFESASGDPRSAEFAAALERNVARMTASIESAVRRHPEQWMWSQRRWRTRPPAPAAEIEQSDPYPPRTGALRWVRHRLRAGSPRRRTA